jgi:hypothetical protein
MTQLHQEPFSLRFIKNINYLGRCVKNQGEEKDHRQLIRIEKKSLNQET